MSCLYISEQKIGYYWVELCHMYHILILISTHGNILETNNGKISVLNDGRLLLAYNWVCKWVVIRKCAQQEKWGFACISHSCKT